MTSALIVASLVRMSAACPNATPDGGLIGRSLSDDELALTTPAFSLRGRSLRLIELNSDVLLAADRCVLASVSESSSRPIPVSDGSLGFIAFESKSSGERRTTIVVTDGVSAWTAFDAVVDGVSLSMANARLRPVLLGAGTPLVYSLKSKRFEKLELNPTKCAGTWLEGDQLSQLRPHLTDAARVSFREIFLIKGSHVEVVGTEGDFLSVSLITATPRGLCFQHRWEFGVGGRGAEFGPPTWSFTGKAVRLNVGASLHLGRTNPDEDPLTDFKDFEFTFDELRLTPAGESRKLLTQ